jgi:hypothetical protein
METNVDQIVFEPRSGGWDRQRNGSYGGEPA